MGCQFLLQRIFLSQGLSLASPALQVNSLSVSHLGSPIVPGARGGPQLNASALQVLEGVPGLPGAPQDEAGLARKFETSPVAGAPC